MFNHIRAIILATLTVTLFQNCSDEKFSKIKAEEKDKTIVNDPIFDDLEEPVLPTVPTPTTPNTPPPSTKVEPDLQVPVGRICSNRYTQAAGGTNLYSSTTLKARVENKADPTEYCETDDADYIKKTVKENGYVVFPKCKITSSKDVVFKITTGSGQTLLLEANSVQASGQRKGVNLKFQIERRLEFEGNNTKPYLDNAFRPLDVLFTSGKGQVDPQLKELCDSFNSPLFVDLRLDLNSPAHLNLTKPEFGVLFDILGSSDPAQPHVQRKISWISRPSVSRHFLFITLPDENGQVKGVDQLFGDNTRGPDGELSENGFTALAKWDGRTSVGVESKNRDGYIDKNDPVYNELRLWSDANINGIAETAELYTMQEVGLRIIDLNYDEKYFERDQHDNRVRFKSVAQMADRRLIPVFDLWFKISQPLD